MIGWQGAPAPQKMALTGRWARLEPLDPLRHGADLLAVAQAPGAEERFRWLPEDPPAGAAGFDGWLHRAAASPDPMFFAVVDRATGRAGGRQALMRIDPGNGVAEIGNILWGPAVARGRLATEAFFLLADHVLHGLGYRRFEWKCNDLNAPSKRAALRFGFTPEGVFRQHMVVKGLNRDTAWFSILDGEWPGLRTRYLAWLDPANFDAQGRQRAPLRVRD